MDALVIVDMLEAIHEGDPKHELSAVVGRINELASATRSEGGQVIFIQHDGKPGEPTQPFTPGWEILESIERSGADRVVRKTLNDSFQRTTLEVDLMELNADRVVITGWATDMCVDATVHSAAALGFNVVVAKDAHTVSDRPHMKAEIVIQHHHWIWENLISDHPVRLLDAEEIIRSSD